MMLTSLESALQRMIGMKQHIGRLLPNAKPHSCPAPGRACNPQNEVELAALCSTRPYTDCVYLCDWGAFHICTDNTCTSAIRANRGELVCPISGVVRGVECEGFTKNVEPHWKPMKDRSDSQTDEIGSPHYIVVGGVAVKHVIITTATTTQQQQQQQPTAAVKRRRVINNVPSRANVMRKVERVIHALLYGPEREQLVKEQLQDRSHQRESRINGYRMECNRRNEFYNLIDEIVICSHCMNRPDTLCVLQPEPARVRYYTGIVLQVWDRALKFLVGRGPSGELTSPKPNVVTITVATLYFMQQGYSPRGIEMLPYDPYLSQLPRPADLPKFELSKRLDTTGTNLIMTMYENALMENVDHKLIQLDYDALAVGIEEDEEGNVEDVADAEDEGTLFKSTSRRGK
jgi:hypothetical protein